jgi:L-ascorbate metabolism protein UlaG (beta-lactamase superfamily)
MRWQWVVFLIVITVGLVTMNSCNTPALLIEQTSSSQFRDGKFHNQTSINALDFSKLGGLLMRYLFEERIAPKPTSTLPLLPIKAPELLKERGTAVYRLGHSTVLMRLNGALWLTDPVFSERASPVQWAGPLRFHPSPIGIDELPDIKGVVISHNHYDHLDQASIKAIHHKVERFFVPLGLRNTMTEWGVPKEKIIELDWWQTTTFDEVTLAATPAQHFSGRGIFDSNKTLWASWVFMTDKERIFYSGDSGYFDGFKEIGKKFGPFDLTMIETGAYDKDWPDVHMQPEESLQAHQDLKGKAMMPVHNGTFDLAMHPWYEPFERLVVLAQAQGQVLVTAMMGERVDLGNVKYAHWWRDMKLSLIDKQHIE